VGICGSGGAAICREILIRAVALELLPPGDWAVTPKLRALSITALGD
jgi:hypothetical protein